VRETASALALSTLRRARVARFVGVTGSIAAESDTFSTVTVAHSRRRIAAAVLNTIQTRLTGATEIISATAETFAGKVAAEVRPLNLTAIGVFFTNAGFHVIILATGTRILPTTLPIARTTVIRSIGARLGPFPLTTFWHRDAHA